MDEEKNEILCRLINELAKGNADALGEIYKILGKNLFLVANSLFFTSFLKTQINQAYAFLLYLNFLLFLYKLKQKL